MTGAAPVSTGGRLLGDNDLRRYADAVVLGCLHLTEGDVLFLQGHVEHRELVVALTESGYRAGASLVDVQYLEPLAQAARIRHAADEHLGPAPPWRGKALRTHLERNAAVVTIIGDADEGAFEGLPHDRVAKDVLAPARRFGWYVRAIEAGRRRWVGVSWPTPYWARKVYPDAETESAERRLAHDLLSFARLGPDDPPGIAGWTTHAEAIAERGNALTELRLDRVELRAPGTELDVRLSPGTRWLGGQEEDAQGRLVASNIPTEENYTSPDARATEGVFRCTRPLAYQGRVIEGIAGELSGGRLVRLEAATEDDRDFLAAFLHGDRNGDRLGEIALVDRTSRIGRAERTYFHTLLDENAVAHIAFGSGFGQSRVSEGSANGRGVNKANLHIDVMIGSDDFEATGIAPGGRRVPLIRDGAWQI
jgi:aminopeptidase